MATDERNERRRDARVATGGSVVLHAHGGARGRALDVSTGGMRIQLARGAPRCRTGDRVSLHLHLDDGAAWLPLRGLVVGADGRGAMSIAFDHVPDDFADVVQDELVAALESATASQILLVDPDGERRTLLAATLRAAGCHVDDVATPLEAITALGAGGPRRWLVAIADGEPSGVHDELRAHVAEAYPCARVVTLDGAANGARRASQVTVSSGRVRRRRHRRHRRRRAAGAPRPR